MRGGKGDFVDYYLKLIMLFLSVAVIVTAIILCCVTESQITDRSITYKSYADGYDSMNYIYACCTNCQTTTANNYMKYTDPTTKNTETYYLWIDQYNLVEVPHENAASTFEWQLSTTTSPVYYDKYNSVTGKNVKQPVTECDGDKKDSNGKCINTKAITDVVAVRTTYRSKQISAFDGSTGTNQLSLYNKCFPNAPSPSYIGTTYSPPVTIDNTDGSKSAYSSYNDWLLVNYCDKDAREEFCNQSKRLPSITPADVNISPDGQGISTSYNNIIVYSSPLSPYVITLNKCNPKWGKSDEGTAKIIENKLNDKDNTYTKVVTADYSSSGSDETISGDEDSLVCKNITGSKDSNDNWVFKLNDASQTYIGPGQCGDNTCTICTDSGCVNANEKQSNFNWSTYEAPADACGTITSDK